MALTRRRLLQRAAGVLAAAELYTLLDGIAKPARATAATRRPEQHLLDGIAIIDEQGIEVLVPPLHHRILTARLSGPVSAARLRAGQARLEHALLALEQRFPATPAGLGLTLGWGLPYFRRLPRLADGRRYPHFLPLDRRASKAAGRTVRALLDATPFASDQQPTLERNDLALLLRSDELAHLNAGERAISAALDGFLELTSIRNGFLGGGFSDGQSIPKQLALAAGIPGADLIPESAQMFLGFTSTQRSALGPDRIANLETLPGLTDQWPHGYFGAGTTMHLSHLSEDLEAWWTSLSYRDQLRAMNRPGLDSVPEQTFTVEQELERASDVHADLVRHGSVGHSGTIQTASRLAIPLVDNHGVARPAGTALIQRADFNSLDNPFAWSNREGEVSAKPAAGLHFVAFAPTTDTFNRTRRAMDGQLGDQSTLGLEARSRAQGLNAFVRATHRQNFLVPPRVHRSYPLAELAAKQR